MKSYKTKLIILLVLFVSIIAIIISFISQPKRCYAVNLNSEPTLEIIGNYSSKIEADNAEVFICIENVDLDINVSKDKTINQFNLAKQSLIADGIDSNSIKITNFSTSPSYDYTTGKTLIGYYAILNFSYKLDDLTLYETSINSLLDIGINDINYINFFLSNAEQIYQINLNKAVEQAIENAKNLLEKEDVELLSIEENTNFYSPILYRNYTIQNNFDNIIEICASVKIKCK